MAFQHLQFILTFAVVCLMILYTVVSVDQQIMHNNNSVSKVQRAETLEPTTATIPVITAEENENLKCLSFEDEMDQLVSTTKQVFIAMPAKAAGTALGSFVMSHCMKDFKHIPGFEGHYFNIPSKVEEMFTLNYELPPIMASHLGRKDKNALEAIAKSASDDTLIVYVHRHELDRMLSGIKQVAFHTCFRRNSELEKYADGVTLDENGDCVMEEDTLHNMIKDQTQEIGNGVHRALTCNFFDVVEERKPNMVILNYKQADALQRVLAKHYCPEVLESDAFPVHVNVAEEKKEILIRLKSDSTRLEPISDWVKVKRNMIEWTFGMKNDVSCLDKVGETERKLLSCQDELMQFTW